MEDNETIADAAAGELQAAKAGYLSKTGTAASRAAAPAEPAAPVKNEQPLADKAPLSAPAAPAPAAKLDEQPGAQAAPPVSSDLAAVSKDMDDIKSRVRELTANGADRSTIDRLNGQIGGLTRIVKKLQSHLMPAENELAGAMAAARKTAEEYPDIGGPLLKAMEAIAAKLPQPKEDPDEEPAATPPAPAAPAAPAAPQFTEAQKALMSALDGVHPDRREINRSAEFNAWLAAKGPEYPQKFHDSWDFAFVAKNYDEFKKAKADKAAAEAAAKTVREKKQQRLAAAETPAGVPAASPSQPTEMDLAKQGYRRYAGKRL